MSVLLSWFELVLANQNSLPRESRKRFAPYSQSPYLILPLKSSRMVHTNALNFGDLLGASSCTGVHSWFAQ